MAQNNDFKPISVSRRTAETALAISVSPGWSKATFIDIPNRLLSHFLDHLAKSMGVTIGLTESDWAGSWAFDHVWCEDLGQLVGRATAAIHEQRSETSGVAGRSSRRSCMDDAESAVSVSFEGRGTVTWTIPDKVDVDGYVDSWYEPGSAVASAAYGTNLRQFIDGLAFGGDVTVSIEVIRVGNLHHLYETIFRNLGDAIGEALGTASVRPGETSGLAALPRYSVDML